MAGARGWKSTRAPSSTSLATAAVCSSWPTWSTQRRRRSTPGTRGRAGSPSASPRSRRRLTTSSSSRRPCLQSFCSMVRVTDRVCPRSWTLARFTSGHARARPPPGGPTPTTRSGRCRASSAGRACTPGESACRSASTIRPPSGTDRGQHVHVSGVVMSVRPGLCAESACWTAHWKMPGLCQRRRALQPDALECASTRSLPTARCPATCARADGSPPRSWCHVRRRSRLPAIP
mmetsp:Transcript_40446/g.120931  ORF Transcript_40446/g.120931 Transcript_40446/m.120931 type:complete len:233 (+) Transcript_40446:578-1276(+)